MWMIIYLLAIPIFSFYIPVFAFWHFDDFSWGKTRATVGKDGKKIVYTAEKNTVCSYSFLTWDAVQPKRDCFAEMERV